MDQNEIDRLTNLINNDLNATKEIETIPCTFYGTRIIKETITSLEVGYKLVRDYEWVEAYNIYNILGGYSCTNINESVVEI